MDEKRVSDASSGMRAHKKESERERERETNKKGPTNGVRFFSPRVKKRKTKRKRKTRAREREKERERSRAVNAPWRVSPVQTIRF